MDTAEAVLLRSLEFEVNKRGGGFEFARGLTYGDHPSDMYEAKCAAMYTPISVGDPIVFNLNKCYCAESAVFRIFIKGWLKEVVSSNPNWVARNDNAFEKCAKALQLKDMQL